MALGTISIKTNAAQYATTRPSSIKVSGSGDAPVLSVSIYDANDTIISTLTNLSLGVEYEIMTAVKTVAGRPEYLIPEPLHRIDFVTDLASAPILKVTGIEFKLNVLGADGSTVIKEVLDQRLTGDVADPLVVGGGICRDYVSDVDATIADDVAADGTILPRTSITSIPAIANVGDHYPAFGFDKTKLLLEYGIVNMPAAKQLRGEQYVI